MTTAVGGRRNTDTRSDMTWQRTGCRRNTHRGCEVQRIEITFRHPSTREAPRHGESALRLSIATAPCMRPEHRGRRFWFIRAARQFTITCEDNMDSRGRTPALCSHDFSPWRAMISRIRACQTHSWVQVVDKRAGGAYRKISLQNINIQGALGPIDSGRQSVDTPIRGPYHT